jgi:hypothetical protein
MVRLYQLDEGLGDVVPQAIFWRPVNYFTAVIRESADDLDDYTFATFEVGNWLRFDLRRYAAHPEFTSTLYLSLALADPADIRHAIARVVGELRVPSLAVAWRRGEPFEFGRLTRRAGDRLREPEARLLALKIAAQMPNRQATTEELIERAPEFFLPSEVDLRPSRTRRHQPRWHQIIRNVISHRHIPLGPFVRGLAQRTDHGLAVTDQGVDHLRSLGFLPDLHNANAREG